MASQFITVLFGILQATSQARALDLDAPPPDDSQCMVQFMQTEHRMHTRAHSHDGEGFAVDSSAHKVAAFVNLSQPSQAHVEEVPMLSSQISKSDTRGLMAKTLAKRPFGKDQDHGKDDPIDVSSMVDPTDPNDPMVKIMDKHPDLVERFGKPRVRAVHDGPFDVSKIADQFGIYGNAEKPPISGWIFLVICVVYTLLAVWYEHRQLQATEKTMSAGSEVSDADRTDAWDLIKIFCLCQVVLVHVGGFMISLYKTSLIMWFFIPIGLPCLIVISGIFSRAVHAKALLTTIIGFPWILFAFGIMLYVVTFLTPGRPCLQFGRSGVEWYLQGMIVWRLVCGPLFSFARGLGVPSIFPFLAISLASYLLWFGIELGEMPSIEIEMEFRGLVKFHDAFPTSEVVRPLAFPWRPMVAWLPTFAFGLLFSPQEWGRILFCDRRLTVAAYSVLALYYGMLTTSTTFANWWDVGCHPASLCVTTWWPVSMLRSGINLETFGIFIRMNSQRLFTMTMWIVVIGSWVGPLKRYVPRTASMLIGCGSRTVYSYLLHWSLFCVPGIRTTFASQFMVPIGFPEYDNAPWSVCAGLTIATTLCVTITLVLSSHFTEFVFGFLVKTPIWVFECLGLLGDKKKHESKAAKETGPQEPPETGVVGTRGSMQEK